MKPVAVSLVVLCACSSSTLGQTPPAADAGLAIEAGPATDAAGAADASTPDGEAAQPVAPRDISTAPWSSFEDDATLSVDGSGTLAAAWIAAGDWRSPIAYAFSHDGGATWTTPGQLPLPTDHFASDPSLDPDGSGGFYLAWTPVDAFGYADAVLVAHSSGDSFEPLSFGDVGDRSQDLFHDQPKIHRTSAGTLLVGYNQRVNDDPGTADQIGVSRSVDRGATWTPAVLAAGSGYRNQVEFCGQTSTGRVLALYLGVAEGLVLAGSDDDGLSWPTSTLSTVVSPGVAANVEFEPTCAVRGDDVWVLYSLGAPGATFDDWKSASIQVVHSSNAGQSWSTPVDARDAAGPSYTKLARLAGVEASGAIDVVYHAGNSAGDPAGTVRWVRSVDGGNTFSQSVVMDDAPFLTTRTGTPGWLGDFLGAAITPGGSLVVAYTKASGAWSHVWAAAAPASGGVAQSAGVDGGDAGDCPFDLASYQLQAWAPPAAHQAACSAADIQALVSGCLDSTTMSTDACEAWARSNLGDGPDAGTACGSCVLAPGGNGGLWLDAFGSANPNYPACMAILGGAAGAGCGAAIAARYGCESAGCDECATQAGYTGCITTVDQGGCQSYVAAEQSACASEDAEGGAGAPCYAGAAAGNYVVDYTSILELVCGSSDGG